MALVLISGLLAGCRGGVLCNAPEAAESFSHERLRRARLGDGVESAERGGISQVVALGGVLYFSAGSPEGGGLWRSDGTPEGTRCVTAEVASPHGRSGASIGRPHDLRCVGGRLFFEAAPAGLESRHGYGESIIHLWMSDGTAEGTVPLMYGKVAYYRSTVPQGIRQPDPGYVGFDVASAGNAFFVLKTQTGLNGEGRTQELHSLTIDKPEPVLLKTASRRESIRIAGSAEGRLWFTVKAALWASDGTVAGTSEIVKNVHDQEGWEPRSRGRATLGGEVLFVDRTTGGPHGLELRKIAGDGAPMVKDIRPGRPGSSPGWLTVLGQQAIFAADDGKHGMELWRTDGTANGTVLVRDIRPGKAGSDPAWLHAIGETIVFVARDGEHGQELWRTDGTEEGTRLIADLAPGRAHSSPRCLAGLGGGVVFLRGSGLWKTDGTAEGTARLLPTISPGTGKPYPRLEGRTFFGRSDKEHGQELWSTDGTEGGARMVRDLDPGKAHSYPGEFIRAGEFVVFCADDGEHGREFWRTDGTEAGTVMVCDIRPGKDGSNPRLLVASGARAYFVADDGEHGHELWMGDPATGETRMLLDIEQGTADARIRNLIDVDGALYFVVDYSIESDWTEAGGPLVADGSAGVVPTAKSDHRMRTITHGSELRRTDGTRSGTEVVKRWLRREVETESLLEPDGPDLRELRRMEQRLHEIPRPARTR
jgi:ELWxxDGT repeat protein